MALQGINMPLMPLGMEALLTATFTSLGLQPSQLEDFFPGPVFLAWVSTPAVRVALVQFSPQHLNVAVQSVLLASLRMHSACMQRPS